MVGPVGNFSSLRGRVVLDRDGGVVGRVEGVYLGQMSGGTGWCVIAGAGGEPDHRLLPLADCQFDEEQIKVPYTGGAIFSSPAIDPAQELSADEEEQLFRFYRSAKGWGPGESPVGSEIEIERPEGWGPGENPIGPEKA